MEIWKNIKNSEFYQISDSGNIRCVGGTIIRNDGKPYTVKPVTRKTDKTRSGYLLVSLALDIKARYLVHRLVLETFKPVPGMEDLQVNHIDGNKSNNVLSNLEWATRKENMQHAMRNGLFHPESRVGEIHPMCKLTTQQVSEIKQRLQDNYRGLQHLLALEYNVSDCTISEIKNRQSRKCG